MQRTPTLLFALACALAYASALAACGDDASVQANSSLGTATQDCQVILAINERCALGGTFALADCVAVNEAQKPACRAATHGYLTCTSLLPCAVLQDPNARNCAAQAVDVVLSCPRTGS